MLNLWGVRAWHGVVLMVMLSFFAWKWEKALLLPAVVPVLPPEPPVMDERLGDHLLKSIVDHDPWSLQREKQQHTEEDSEAKAKILAVKSKEHASLRWYLRGTARGEDGEMFAVVVFSGKHKEKRYIRGDRLPDGAYIDRIVIDGMVVRKGERVRMVGLFGK